MIVELVRDVVIEKELTHDDCVDKIEFQFPLRLLGLELLDLVCPLSIVDSVGQTIRKHIDHIVLQRFVVIDE